MRIIKFALFWVSTLVNVAKVPRIEKAWKTLVHKLHQVRYYESVVAPRFYLGKAMLQLFVLNPKLVSAKKWSTSKIEILCFDLPEIETPPLFYQSHNFTNLQRKAFVLPKIIPLSMKLKHDSKAFKTEALAVWKKWKICITLLIHLLRNQDK